MQAKCPSPTDIETQLRRTPHLLWLSPHVPLGNSVPPELKNHVLYIPAELMANRTLYSEKISRTSPIGRSFAIPRIRPSSRLSQRKSCAPSSIIQPQPSMVLRRSSCAAMFLGHSLPRVLPPLAQTIQTPCISFLPHLLTATAT